MLTRRRHRCAGLIARCRTNRSGPMRPSFSVIVFTVLAGAGYGIWIWLGLALNLGAYPLGRSVVLVPLAIGFVLVSAGLLASTLHLGKSQRAWRDNHELRSSWLSREVVLAIATYLPMVAVVLLAHGRHLDAATRAAGLLLSAGAFATIYATANIYHSLKPIEAWRHALVPPGYLLMAMISGGLWLWMYLALRQHAHHLTMAASTGAWLAGLQLLLASSVWLKRAYWAAIDRQRAAPRTNPGDVTGLDHFGQTRALEPPHSEENYLLREMGFVMARRHREPLRTTALMLGFVLPLVLVGAGMLVPRMQYLSAPLAVVLGMWGLFIERWLFFADARHRVSASYRQD